ncbi:MAG: hypothetical protein WDZ80_02375, partial [Candidatus Paceibacterota bacterium]
KLSGKEKFKNTDNKKFSVNDFWQYGFSNLSSNVTRGVLAEFIIENALKDSKKIELRNPWGDYDIEYKGKKIEVKCSSYIQDWDQEKLTRISWSGLKAKTLYWSSAVNKKLKEEKKSYKADIYILSLLHHKEPKTLDILNMSQWSFFVLSKKQLKDISADANSLSLSTLEKKSVEFCKFEEIKDKVDSLL